MEAYVLWLEQFRKFKYKWIHSDDKINCFVVHAIPPGRQYTTKTHCELVAAIGSRCQTTTRINHREKSVTVEDGTPLKPTIFFNTKKSMKNYPVDLDFDQEFTVAVKKIKVSSTPMDVLDSFGIISYKLHDFKRVNILRIVRAMEITGFGVLHNGGLISSDGESTGESSDRFCSKLPHRDDPVWFFA
ncbi:unnamed protein product [Ectocarpus sp. 12 AP-2014]